MSKQRPIGAQSQVPALRLAPCSMRHPLSGIRTRLELTLVPSQPLLDLRSCLRFPIVAQCALPNDGHSPSGIKEVTSIPSVSLHVFRKLGLPEVSTRRRCRRVSATRMPVPVAAVNEAHGFEASEHEVRSPWETSIVQSVSEASGVKCQSKSKLGLCTSAPDSRHHARPGGWIHYVRHQGLTGYIEVVMGLISHEDLVLIKPYGVGFRSTQFSSVTGPACPATARDGLWTHSRQQVLVSGTSHQPPHGSFATVRMFGSNS